MFRPNKLLGKLVEEGHTQKEAAAFLGLEPRTFYNRMHDGKFTVPEVTRLAGWLHLTAEDIIAIFFAPVLSETEEKQE